MWRLFTRSDWLGWCVVGTPISAVRHLSWSTQWRPPIRFRQLALLSTHVVVNINALVTSVYTLTIASLILDRFSIGIVS
ncbi:unnamed protein product [Calypogeia fissa]